MWVIFPGNHFLDSILLISLVSLGSAPPSQSSDPLAVLLDAYKDAVAQFQKREGLSEKEVVQFREDWRARLREACKKFPDSPEWAVAMTKVVGLCNSLQDFKASDEAIQLIIQRARSPSERMRWFGERAEAAKLQYRSDPRPELRELAKESYTEALHIADSNLGEKMSPQEKCNYAVYAGQLSTLLAELSQPEAAISWLRKARKLISACRDCELHLAGSDYDSEGLSRIQLNLAIHQHNVAIAEEALTEIAKYSSDQKQLRINLSDYVYRAASGLYSDMPDEYQRFIATWLKKIAPDEWTPCLEFFLARSYYENKQLDAAEKIYVRLAADHKPYFLKKDAEALARQSGGYFAEILANLAAIHLVKGDTVEARKLKEMLRELVPKDPKLDGVDSNLLNIETERKKLEEFTTKPKSSRGVFIAINFLAILVIVGFLTRKYYRRAQ